MSFDKSVLLNRYACADGLAGHSALDLTHSQDYVQTDGDSLKHSTPDQLGKGASVHRNTYSKKSEISRTRHRFSVIGATLEMRSKVVHRFCTLYSKDDIFERQS